MHQSQDTHTEFQRFSEQCRGLAVTAPGARGSFMSIAVGHTIMESAHLQSDFSTATNEEGSATRAPEVELVLGSVVCSYHIMV